MEPGLSVADTALIDAARSVLHPRRLSPSVEVAGVGSALRTASGAVYLGVCIDAQCGIGFCAEHSAIAAMITAGEQRIETIVAVNRDGTVLLPCGRCREFIAQVDEGNADTRVILALGVRRLKELLPDHWLIKS